MAFEQLEILDTTLRDGSYVIDFQFTAEDTALITSTLEFAGIGLIEIGHGLGLGAARAGKGEQACPDEDYLQAAAKALSRAKFGTFFIPGIGTEDDVRMAADHGAHFIRIGTNVNEVAQAEPFVSIAKERGLIVFVNLMKSYAIPPDEFGECARQAEEFGADVLCVVDSAGGMLPADVRAYLEAARAKCALKLGFHGHNNLSMAIANSLEAAEAGAIVLDASLQGMGRSEGNASTEVLASILQKRARCDGIDVNALLDASEAFIRPMLQHVGYSGMGVTTGRAQFHSSFLGTVLATAHEYGVDPRELVLEVGARDKVNAPDDLVRDLAQSLQQRGPRTEVRFAIPDAAATKPKDLIELVRDRAAELKEKARKHGIPSVLNIVVGPHEPASVSPFVQADFGCALSNVMLEDVKTLDEVINAADGTVDYFLLDPGQAHAAALPTTASPLLTYSDAEMWARACVAHLCALLDGGLHSKTVLLLGENEIATTAERALRAEGVSIATRPEDVAAVVAISPRTPVVGADVVSAMPEGALLYDAGIGSLTPEALALAETRNIRVVRIDMRPTLAATALERINARSLVEGHMGRAEWDGVRVIAGGLIGKLGDVVVDSIREPKRVIGIADGKGGIREANEGDTAVQSVRRAIAQERLRS